jgi:hypothetical protein
MSREDDRYFLLYQTTRAAVTGFDTILVTLLTQGNTFVLALLSLPVIASLQGIEGAGFSIISLIMSLYMLWANLFYMQMLKCAVIAAEEIERHKLDNIVESCHLTHQLSKIPFSATNGSAVLYLGLPCLWAIASVIEGGIFLRNHTLTFWTAYAPIVLFVFGITFLVYKRWLRRPAIAVADSGENS